MVLAGTEIANRIGRGDIFRPGTFDPGQIQEASYDLRVAADGLFLDGRLYPPGSKFPNLYLEIKPGEIAVLSTIESPLMPLDLVGRLGVKFDYTIRGLTPLFGFQVDPGYGSNVPDERLYLRVANLGAESITFRPGDAVFNLELHSVQGEIRGTSTPREPTWKRIERALLRDSTRAASSHSESIRRELTHELRQEVSRIERGWQQVVFFGVFLVAASVLGVVLAILFNVANRDPARVPEWFQSWGWVFLFIAIGLALVITLGVGLRATLTGIVGRRGSK